MQGGELPLSKRKKGDKKRKMGGGTGCLTLYRKQGDAMQHARLGLKKKTGCRVIAVIGSARFPGDQDHCPVSHRVRRNPRFPTPRVIVLLYQSTRVPYHMGAESQHHTDIIVSINPSHPALQSSGV